MNMYDDMPVIVNVKPDDQLDLPAEELTKEHTCVLYPNNPRAPHNITQYSFKDRQYKSDDQVDQMVVHLQMDATILKNDSQEAKTQEEILMKKMEAAKNRNANETFDMVIDEDPNEKAEQNTLRNQFNFSERGSQTYNEVQRTTTIATQPPLCRSFADTVTQWSIFDSYMAEANKANAGASKSGDKKALGSDFDNKKKPSESDPIYSDAMKLSIKLMERIVNQNAENDVYHDFKYWEDKSDEYRPEGDGTVLPLWRFVSEKAKRKQVTALRWNQQYSDLFAVGFGSYDFVRQGTGCICCYSVKNTKFPEYIYNTDSGVCSIDWHPTRRGLLAVGLYDGTVLVYDVKARTKKPIYGSTIRTNKHSDPVWEVRWNESSEGQLSFYSISADGRVSTWLLMKDKLESEEMMALKLYSGEEEDTGLTGLAGGLCFDFHKTNDLFLIGTEEGRIHKCSKLYSGQYLDTYEGHSMAVYTVRWNNFHSNIFISSSADWTVKLWDHNCKTPVMSFDLAQQVGDVAWAPYSSTVFAAVTSDSRLHVYDLSVNRNGPLCLQNVVNGKAKCTHLSFNSQSPILVVGDDRGGVSSLKLSPNLRKALSENLNVEDEINKMNELLSNVVETVE